MFNVLFSSGSLFLSRSSLLSGSLSYGSLSYGSLFLAGLAGLTTGLYLFLVSFRNICRGCSPWFRFIYRSYRYRL